MKPLSPDVLAQVLAASEQNLHAGKAADVRAAMSTLIQLHPKSAAAHRLLGLACQVLNDHDLAEQALRDAVTLDKKEPRHHADLGGFLAAQDRTKEAERAYRTALALNRMFGPAAAGLSRLLVRLGRAREALQATTPLVAKPKAGPLVLAAHGQALRALGREDEGLAFFERAVIENPTSAHSYYRLAGAFSDLGRHADAETALKAAIERGYDNAEARLGLAHVLQDQERFDEAEVAYREALVRQPDHLQVHNDLAELIWMRTGDVGAALETLDAMIEARPGDWHLLFAKWKALSHAGDPDAAFEAIEAAVAQFPDGPILLTTAARAASAIGRTVEALDRAERAAALQPADRGVRGVLVQACLGVGQTERAAGIVEAMVAEEPDDQFALALQAVCWRLLGDPRYAALYDYADLVRVTEFATPKGWKNLKSYLADFSAALHGLHKFKAHPFGQSVRGGSQVVLRHTTDPVVRTIHEALDAPIREAIAKLGKGPDPLRRRNTGGYRFNGLWSVRLVSAGYHDDHVHPGGWLSSACYIDLPELGDEASKAGWLKFGEPGRLITVPPLGAEHFVEPQPGKFVLFPSYMWHGTVPFEAERPRLSVAFDLVPA